MEFCSEQGFMSGHLLLNRIGWSWKCKNICCAENKQMPIIERVASFTRLIKDQQCHGNELHSE